MSTPAPSLARPHAPTSLTLPDLLRTTDEHAAQVLDGRLEHLLPADGYWPTRSRWYARLHADEELDVWLISWAPDRSTELHDHAGSLGALTVVDGTLTEQRWTGAGLRTRKLTAGAQAAFPLGWVHDVVNAEPAAPSRHRAGQTLSVHAYSPPLTAMSYYDISERGTLHRTRSVLTEYPEDVHPSAAVSA